MAARGSAADGLLSNIGTYLFRWSERASLTSSSGDVCSVTRRMDPLISGEGVHSFIRSEAGSRSLLPV